MKFAASSRNSCRSFASKKEYPATNSFSSIVWRFAARAAGIRGDSSADNASVATKAFQVVPFVLARLVAPAPFFNFFPILLDVLARADFYLRYDTNRLRVDFFGAGRFGGREKTEEPTMPKQIFIPPPRWVTRETAQYLRASERSVQNYRDHEGLPHIRVSPRKILYDPKEVERWAKQRSRKSNGQP